MHATPLLAVPRLIAPEMASLGHLDSSPRAGHGNHEFHSAASLAFDNSVCARIAGVSVRMRPRPNAGQWGKYLPPPLPSKAQGVRSHILNKRGDERGEIAWEEEQKGRQREVPTRSCSEDGSGRTTCWRQRENSLARQMQASAREEIGADDGTRVVGMRRQEHGPELQG
ncbi:hypothetical protein VTO73DRAFT_11377 [Trametes versicolor]